MLIHVEGDAYQNTIFIKESRLGERLSIPPGRMVRKANATHASILHIGYTDCIELSGKEGVRSAGIEQCIQQSDLLLTEWSACVLVSQP